MSARLLYQILPPVVNSFFPFFSYFFQVSSRPQDGVSSLLVKPLFSRVNNSAATVTAHKTTVPQVQTNCGIPSKKPRQAPAAPIATAATGLQFCFSPLHCHPLASNPRYTRSGSSHKEEAKPSTLAVCPNAAVMRKKGSSAWTANAGLSTPAVTKALTTVDKADAVSHLSPRLRP